MNLTRIMEPNSWSFPGHPNNPTLSLGALSKKPLICHLCKSPKSCPNPSTRLRACSIPCLAHFSLFTSMEQVDQWLPGRISSYGLEGVTSSGLGTPYLNITDIAAHPLRFPFRKRGVNSPAPTFSTYFLLFFCFPQRKSTERWQESNTTNYNTLCN